MGINPAAHTSSVSISTGTFKYAYLKNKKNSLGENINYELEEVNLEPIDSEIITLKKPNEVYYEIYKAARKKAKNMKKMAVAAYLEAKDIKTKYMLNDISDSDSDNDDDYELNNA